MPVTRFLVVAGTGVGAAALAVLLVAVTAPTFLSASPARPADDQTPGRSVAMRPERVAAESGTVPGRHGETTTKGSTRIPGPAATSGAPVGGQAAASAPRHETGPAGHAPQGLPRTGGPAGTLRHVLRHAVPGSTITSSSVAPSGDVLQVTLTASTLRRPAAVLRWWRIHLTRLGLHEVRTRSVAGSEAAAFSLGRSSATITVTRPGGARETTYSVFATLSDRKT